MNQDSLTRLCIVNCKNDKALSAVIFVKHEINFPLKKHFLFLNLFFIMIPFGVKAQETLSGLTSNGGVQGRGTVFTIKTNATAFTIVKALPDWGKNPWGDLLKGDDGNFYGMTSIGGTFTYGTIFKATPAGVVTVLHHLDYATDGANPYGELIKGADGNFYGLTSSGGATSHGTIFKITPSGVFTVIRHLIGADGTNPRGHLVLGADGNFYGATYSGGANGYGTIFKMTPTGTFTVLHSLSSATDGANCYGSLVKGSDNNFYGTTNGGGTSGFGTIFKITATGTYTVLHTMISTDGVHSQSDLIQATDGNFYGMAFGGATGFGTIFKITSGGTFTVLKNLSAGTDGQSPYGALLQGTDGNFYGMTSGSGANGGGTIFKITPTGTLTVLRALLSTADGGNPRGSLVKGADGNYYGMTYIGGSNFYGTFFKISATGTFTVLTRLNGGIIGNAPYESLIQGTDYAYYGTTIGGGTNDQGTVFKICGGTYTVLHSFTSSTEGGLPKGSLVQASDGNFYGLTSTGGGGSSNSGTIFKITSSGTFTVLHHLVSASEGSLPQGSLIQGSDSYLYGLTSAGGTGGAGTVFKISTSGTYKVIRQLVSATDGSNPEGNLVKGAGGVDSFFYGMTKSRIFKISPNGTLFTILHTLISSDGYYPLGSLVRATDGNFYGTTSSGGGLSSGTIFKTTPTGTLTVLRNLNSATDGGVPKGNLIQAADGFLYGLTSAGGTNKAGTIFKISTLGAFTILRHLNLATDGGTPFGSLIIQKTLALVANPQSVSTAEDVAKSIVLTGSGGSPLTFKISTNPKNGTVTGSGATRTYTPKANYNGKDSFYFTSNVGCVASLPAKVNITIIPVNDTPVLAPIGNKSVKQGMLLTFTATATDVDAGQTKTFSLITPPSGATIGASTGVFNWTPSATGSFTFKVRVTDNGSPVLYDEEQITVTVTASARLVARPTLTTIKRNEENLPNKTGLYPNPVRDKFMVTLDQSYLNISGIITDMNGVIVRRLSPGSINSGKFEIEVSDLSTGTYVMKLDNGIKKWVFKFVKL